MAKHLSPNEYGKKDLTLDEAALLLRRMDDELMNEFKAIACNYAEATKTASVGAIAYVTLSNPGNAHERIFIVTKSRGGRWIAKWERTTRLNNFRLKTVVEGSPEYRALARKFNGGWLPNGTLALLKSLQEASHTTC